MRMDDDGCSSARYIHRIVFVSISGSSSLHLTDCGRYILPIARLNWFFGKHYRDNTGLEVDAVVQRADGRWAAFEIKLGAGHVDIGAAALLKFAKRVDTSKSGEPGTLAVITSTGYGYVREDGIGVIPIGALGP